MEDLYAIGNYDKSLEKYLEKNRNAIGIGINEKWIVSISRCAKYSYAALQNTIEFVLSSFKDKSKKKKIEEILTQELLFNTIKEEIAKAVLEEIIHAYGDATHDYFYAVRYKNENERGRVIREIISSESYRRNFRIEERRYYQNGKLKEGEFSFTPKTNESPVDYGRLIAKLSKKAKVKALEGKKIGTKFEALIDEIITQN